MHEEHENQGHPRGGAHGEEGPPRRFEAPLVLRSIWMEVLEFGIWGKGRAREGEGERVREWGRESEREGERE